MKRTTFKMLFLLLFTFSVTFITAQTAKKSTIPHDIEKVLEKIHSVENIALNEPAGLLTKEEKHLLKDFYQTSDMSSSRFRAFGDVYALDVRNGGDYGSFPLTGPFNIASVAVIPNDIYAADFDSTGTLYALETTNANLLTVDPATGTLTVVAPLTGAAAGVTFSGLSWNPTNDTMYALTTDGVVSTLYTIDLTTGVMTAVGETGTILGIWIAIDNAGIIYMADLDDDNLYTLDSTTGAGTVVGPLGVDISFAQEANIDPLTNTLYMAGYIGGGVNNIYSVDVTTGTATSLGPVNDNDAELGMFAIDGGIDNNFICDDAISIGLGVIPSNGPSNAAGGASNICEAGATNSEWYAYTAENSGNLTITSDLVSNVGVDTRVSVYNDDCTALACIDSDDNSGADNTSTVVIPVVSGTTYLIEWDDANDNAAFDFELSLAIACPDPENFTNDAVTDTSADFSWDDVAGAANGYILSVFNAGDDPDVDTPVYTESIPSGTLTATATPLSPDSMFDAYLVADCDTEGLSNAVSVSFETELTPPACGGTYTDTGGSGGDYMPSENITTTITPDVVGEVVTVTFTYVDIEASAFGDGTQEGCWDFLTVYNGPDTSSPVLAQTLCGEESGDGGEPFVPGSLLSVGMSFTSTDASGALTFVFTSDDSVQETGWVADVTCGPPPTCVTPDAFTNTLTTDTEATYTWGAIANASNGYVFSVFNAGDDPDVDAPVYTENVPFGTNTATATGLIPATPYDAYIMADCDADGVSDEDSNSFTTEAADAVCDGNYVDSGGVSGGYAVDEITTTTISPDVAGEAVTVTFTYVDIEANAFGEGTQEGCWDFLTVYDGPDNTYPILANTLCGEESGDGDEPSVPGSLLSVGMSFTSTDASGALTFVFTSDGSVAETGWLADITCATLSIDEFDLAQFNYYPNPTTGLLHVNAKQSIETIRVYNMLGQEVMSLNPKAMEATLDFSSLSQGAYFLRSSINGNISTHKVIKK
ncbi:T9SS type A sorting domain-containing protein [Lacinutrix iliipiscaria]|uniref:T9SS type A sorting domain-containing protein n=1 Tax=Lacinutrix iliipiscaria TaxID=1230532 RepID=A0ABW5WMC0_9FLAO